jgi:deoxyribonuclease-4
MPAAVEQGLSLGCEAIQVFTRNQRQWTPAPLDPGMAKLFRAGARKAGYDRTALSHASYLINLCAPDPQVLARSRAALADEISRCAALGIPFLCLHPGAHMGAGEEAGVALVAESVRLALAATRGLRVTVLLENTAGQGTCIGHRLEHLAGILRGARSRRTGVCIDTCHIFAAGYDLRGDYDGVIREIDRVVGLGRVRAFHLNDSRKPLGSRVDRHEHVGEGELSDAPFRRLVNDPRFRDLPGILETPDGPDAYARNLDRLRSMRTK